MTEEERFCLDMERRAGRKLDNIRIQHFPPIEKEENGTKPNFSNTHVIPPDQFREEQEQRAVEGGIVPRILHSAAEFEGVPVPPRQWLCETLIPMGIVTMLSGDGGTGKSILGLHLAASVATGSFWLGHQVERGPAVVFASEDDRNELHRRLNSIRIGLGDIPFSDMADLHFRAAGKIGEDSTILAELDTRRNRIDESKVLRALYQGLEEINPRLIVLDTLADLHTENENDRSHAVQVINILKRIALTFDCAVVFLSHPSLTGRATGTGASGSTAWVNSSRAQLYLDRIRFVENGNVSEADSDLRTLAVKKSNYGDASITLTLKYKNGIFERHGDENTLDRLQQEGEAQRVFLTLLDEFTEQGRVVSANSGANFVPAVFADHPTGEIRSCLSTS